MDQNEMIQQLANNPQILAQLVQAIQQNNMNPQNQANQPVQKQPVSNWNMPTNPMASIWWNNMMNAMNSMMNNQNNQGDNQPIPNNQNPPQQSTQNEQQLDEKVLPIRTVKSVNDISVDQIPMNDKISFFMQEGDSAVIYGKRWTNKGTIDDLRYVLEKSEPDVVAASNDSTTGNLPFDMEEMMSAVGRVVDSKLEEFKRDYSLDTNNGNNNNNQSKNRNNRKG